MVTTMQSRPVSARDQLQTRCEDLIAAEMARLARRVPGLSTAHRGQVQAALGRLADELVLSRAHTVCDDQLVLVFGIARIP